MNFKTEKVNIKSFAIISVLIKDSIECKKNIENGIKALRIGNFVLNMLEETNNDIKFYVIFNIPYEDARVIAKNFGQEQFFYIKVNGNNLYIDCYKSANACITYKCVETQMFNDEESANLFLSKHGCNYQINLDKLVEKVKPIINEEEFDASMQSFRTFMSRSSHRRASYIIKN